MADIKQEKYGDDDEGVIKEGRHVILKWNNLLRAVLVQRNRKVQHERLRIVMNEAIGCPFGSVFDVKGERLQRVNEQEEVDELRNTDNGDQGIVYQAIKSEGVTQKLSREDVVSLKAQGATGKDIVNQLVENSATFKDRTEFSKAKYRSKKAKKHSSRITVYKPTTALISKMYYSSKLSNRVCDLRPDALSQILTLANVRASSKLIVMEQCQGLIVGAALERMGGYGDIVHLHHGDFPSRVAMDYYDFTPEALQIVHGYQLIKMDCIEDPDPDKVEKVVEVSQVVNDVQMDVQTHVQTDVQTVVKAEEIKNPEQSETEGTTCEKNEKTDNSMKEEEKIARRNKRRQEEKKAKELLRSRNMDGLIVVCKFYPSSVVVPLLEFVAPSRPFVVYSQFKEPLVECYNDLRAAGGIVNMQLTETWWRHYQVLPGRTHPLVTMDGSGGYLLSGITVERPTRSRSPQTTVTPTTEDSTLEPPTKKSKDD